MMTTLDIRNALLKDGNGYISVNKNLLHQLGVNSAIIYCAVISMHSFYEGENTLDVDGFFFCTIDRLLTETSLSARQQLPALRKLQKMGLVDIKYSGLPKRRYIKPIVDEKAQKIIFSKPSLEKQVRGAMPEEVYDEYSKEFDYEILKSLISKACIKYPECGIREENVLELYRIYNDRCRANGYFTTFYTQKAVDRVIENIYDLDSEYDILDNEIFINYVDEYFELNFEGSNITPSLNNMLFSNQMMDILTQKIM